MFGTDQHANTLLAVGSRNQLAPASLALFSLHFCGRDTGLEAH